MKTAENLTDAEIRKLERELAEERIAADATVRRCNRQIDDCNIALSHRHQGRHPNDPDYPTCIESAKERVAQILNTRQAKEQ